MLVLKSVTTNSRVEDGLPLEVQDILTGKAEDEEIV